GGGGATGGGGGATGGGGGATGGGGGDIDGGTGGGSGMGGGGGETVAGGCGCTSGAEPPSMLFALSLLVAVRRRRCARAPTRPPVRAATEWIGGE
ncbi:MAG: MYXO-CTERM sorting domain-containing protein, partial [Myxococcota bacterium]